MTKDLGPDRAVRMHLLAKGSIHGLRKRNADSSQRNEIASVGVSGRFKITAPHIPHLSSRLFTTSYPCVFVSGMPST